MSVELDGAFGDWDTSSGFLGGFEKTETTWRGRDLVLESSGRREVEIFKEKQVQLAIVHELQQKDKLTLPLCGAEIEYPLPYEQLLLDHARSELEVIRCGLRKFWKKHKKAILITAAAVVVVAGVTIAAIALWPAAASTAAGVGGSIAAGLSNNESKPSPQEAPTPTPPPSTGSSQTYTLPPPAEPPKSTLGTSYPSPPSLPPIDLRSMLPSSSAPLPGFQLPPVAAPFSFSNPKISSPLPTHPIPSSSPPLSNWDIKPGIPSFSTFSAPSAKLFPPLPWIPGAPTPFAYPQGTNVLPISELISKIFPPLPTLPGAQECLAFGTLLNNTRIPLPTSTSLLVDQLKETFFSKNTPSTSIRFPTLGARNPDILIQGMNGMDTTWEGALSHQAYLRTLVNDRAPVDFVYNHTNGRVRDGAEIITLNYFGFSPNTAKLLVESWQEFADLHKDNPNKKILQPCHSQGAIHVYNALASASPELRDRIIVVAVAPAKVIPREMCYRSFNYASNSDKVPYGEFTFACIVAAGTHPDFDTPEVWTMARDNLEELIWLKRHPDANPEDSYDHGFQSPTYKEVLTERLEDYINHNGEYP